jgi:hypothetical protein
LIEKTGFARLRKLVADARRDLFAPVRMEPPTFRRRRVTQKGLTPEVRSGVVTKLVGAIEEAERLAKASGKRTRTGGGGISPKERWYQLMGYLAQVLDGVLKNLDLESVKEKMDQMEMALDELQRTNPTTG